MKPPAFSVLLLTTLLAACTTATASPTVPPATAAPTQAVVTNPTATVASPTDAPPATAANTDEPAPTEPPEESTPTPAPTQAPTQAPVLPPDPGAYTFELVMNGFVQPLLVTHAGDGSGRLFVVEQTGRIRVVQDGQIVAAPFLDLRGQVTGGYEQGLLGLAFHPDYAQNGTFFIYYTDLAGDEQIERCQVSESDPNVGDRESCTTLLSVDDPYANHNGGGIAFGPDGYLYLGIGDGGSGGDPDERAQDLTTLMGKMLRLEVDGDEAPYTVPPDNPFVGRDDAKWEIWAYGLRNPWRWSFDRATGDLYIADVGQNAYEEVNFQPADSPGGENYGWDFYEGLHEYSNAGDPAPPIPAGVDFVEPIAEYAHATTGGCSVTGGYVYRGPSLPELSGVYFYGDACNGLVWALVPADGGWQVLDWANTGWGISSFGEDQAGELYVCDLYSGSIYRLARAGA